MRKFDSWEEWETFSADVLDQVSDLRNSVSMATLEDDFKDQIAAIDTALDLIEKLVEQAEPEKRG